MKKKTTKLLDKVVKLAELKSNWSGVYGER
jgi:hypothetical protein